MRRSPSIVPQSNDQDVYLVLDDFGGLGCSWRETDEMNVDRAALRGSVLRPGPSDCFQYCRGLVA
jgi:hypothetical protein